jgi:phosphonate transport system ATP-binding protein
VPAGQMVVLIGSSGSGKSTLLRHLNGLETATSGTAEVLGQRPGELSGRQLRHLRGQVGFIFQQFNLAGRLTALENVLTGASARLRLPRYGVMTYPMAMRREALGQLDRVGLADQAFQRCDTLSGGQQQRVAIARALFQRPALMLADEPVAAHDPEASAQVMQLLLSICADEGLTVLCSLHQVDLALGWAQRMVGLRAGRVVLDREAHQLTADEARKVYRGDDVPSDVIAPDESESDQEGAANPVSEAGEAALRHPKAVQVEVR